MTSLVLSLVIGLFLSPEESGRVIRVDDSPPTAAAELVDPASYVGNVYGTVSDGAALPLAGATIELFDDQGQEVTEARSSPSGAFLIAGVPAAFDGQFYRITASMEGRKRSTIERVRVLPGAAMALEITFRLTPAGGANAATSSSTSWHYRHESADVPPSSNAYGATIFATREGLVGGTTANGHVIVPDDHFAALPSRRALSTNFGYERQVRLTYRGRSVVVPVWDVGPWNIRDDYWNPAIIRESFKDLPRGLPEAEAAFRSGYNRGLDGSGRIVRNPAGIDLADGTFRFDLALPTNDSISVEYLWLDSKGPVVSSFAPVIPIVRTPIVLQLLGSVTDILSGNSPIVGAEAFVDLPGADGTGLAATAEDGAFDQPAENVSVLVSTASWAARSSHTIYLHAVDAYGNWGPFTTTTVIAPPLSRRRSAGS